MKRLLQKLGLRKRDKVSATAARYTIRVQSTVDRHRQPCLFIPAKNGGPQPLLVYLHPWRHRYDFDSTPWQVEAAKRNWHFLAPDFRGPNRRPQACASRLARQDVLDAVDWACANHEVDENRIYLGGCSGGGHMALIMAGEAPDRWAAVSAWCSITDLAAFHAECRAMDAKAYRHVEKVAGGAPGSSAEVDRELRYRSPVFHMDKAAGLPVDIAHGIHDGQPRGIGVQHSVWAFNALAKSVNGPAISDEELELILARNTLDLADRTDPTDRSDPSYDRPIYFRRSAGASRLTIFDGGHEDLPHAACAWFDRHPDTSGTENT
ncbi:MAG: prolyl oligopeptidase family serine peptidase [Candidatus Hydrogenedentes bacterium]|nr:prolyl oligopeptidase family serine peptidase [Candidatus Hydrogenedentota bacterium]